MFLNYCYLNYIFKDEIIVSNDNGKGISVAEYKEKHNIVDEDAGEKKSKRHAKFKDE